MWEKEALPGSYKARGETYRFNCATESKQRCSGRGTFSSISETSQGKKLCVLMEAMLIYSFNKLNTGIVHRLYSDSAQVGLVAIQWEGTRAHCLISLAFSLHCKVKISLTLQNWHEKQTNRCRQKCLFASWPLRP